METQKQQIQRLQNELEQAKERIFQQEQEIEVLKGVSNNFELIKCQAKNDQLYNTIQKLKLENEDMKNTINSLKLENESLYKKNSPVWEIQDKLLMELQIENKELKQKFKSVHKSPVENERKKVGRKERFDSQQIMQIKEIYEQGQSIRQLAAQFNCSIGLIHKIINNK